VLGSGGVNTVYESTLSGFESSIYELGYPNIGNSNYLRVLNPTTPPNYRSLPNTLEGCQQLDLNVKATILRHGNFDYVNNHVIWDPAIPDHTIPNSLYLSGKPSWWGVLPWPPIGPDKSPMVGPIPAQQRFQTCGSLLRRLDRLQRRREQLRQHHRRTPKLNRQINQLQRQLQLQDC